MITPDMVLAAYRETKLTPGRYAYYFEDGASCRACAVGALVLQREPDFPKDVDRETPWVDAMTEMLDVSEPYIHGLVRGFDGQHPMDSLDYALSRVQPLLGNDGVKEVMQGFYDGEQIWFAVYKELMDPEVTP